MQRGPEAGLRRELGRGAITTLVMARNSGNAERIFWPINFQKTRAFKVGNVLMEKPSAVWHLLHAGLSVLWLGSVASPSQMLLMGLPLSAG